MRTVGCQSHVRRDDPQACDGHLEFRGSTVFGFFSDVERTFGGAKSVSEEPPRLLPSNKDIFPAIHDSLGVSEKKKKKGKDVRFSIALQNVGLS